MSPNHQLTVDSELNALAAAFEKVEVLGVTEIPLPYAQLQRIVIIIYLATVPFAVVIELGWMALLLSFLANAVYFTADECASEMAAPFGEDANDVDIEKHIRRLDKHTASTLSVHIGLPVENFDLYAETRSANVDGSSRALARGKSLYELEDNQHISCKRLKKLATKEKNAFTVQVDDVGKITTRKLNGSMRNLRSLIKSRRPNSPVAHMARETTSRSSVAGSLDETTTLSSC